MADLNMESPPVFPTETPKVAVPTAGLGMEARSILKSIQTEEAKLIQSPQLSRSDFAYFRARFNYYRLSLKRLPTEEREFLEPSLAKFLQRITTLEARADEVTLEGAAVPFLSAVGPQATPIASPAPIQSSPAHEAVVASDRNIPRSLADCVSELSLVKLALMADLTSDAKRLLGESLDRVIDRLKR